MFERVLVTARRLHGDRPFGDAVADAARRHHATLIVVREKDLDDALLTEAVGAVLDRTDVPVVVAHRPEVAAETGAAGVHLGWTSGSVAEAREKLEPHALVGVSVHDVNEGLSRAADGADYLFLGPVQATPKSHAVAPIGWAPIEELASRVSIPVVAIGGLGLQDLVSARAAGAAGIAAIRAFR